MTLICQGYTHLADEAQDDDPEQMHGGHQGTLEVLLIAS